MSDATESSLKPIDALNKLLLDDLSAVNDALHHMLQSRIPAMNSIVTHLIASGGKRIRPKLLVLSGLALGLNHCDTQLMTLAAVTECIHTATLLHDDVIDESDERRGQATANHRWGNPAAVLAGDFLYARSFQTLVELNHPSITTTLTDAVARITEGELLQLFASKESCYHESTYNQIIEAKTAVLFQASCQIGAMAACPNTHEHHQAFASFGHHLGMAFQITDDILDYVGDPALTGKPQGSDLMQGKVTLPLILALESVDQDKKEEILKLVKSSSNAEALQTVLSLIKRTGAIEHTLDKASDHGEKARLAIASFDDSPAKDALLHLVDFACQRAH